MEQRPKASLEADLRHHAMNAGPEHLIPHSAKECMRLMSFLRSDVTFFVACCEPYAHTEETCKGCGESLWTCGQRRRPRHIFFVRKVRPWIERMMRVQALEAAVQHMRSQEHQPGVWTDIIDGSYIQDLIRDGMHRVVSISNAHRDISTEIGLSIHGKLGRLSAIQEPLR